MKLFGKILSILVIILIGAVLLRNQLIKGSVVAGAKIVTGIDLRIERFNLGLTNGLIEINNFELLNPKGFQDKVMVSVPEVYVDYSLGDIIKQNYYFPEIRFHLKEINIVKNEKGELNIDSLKAMQASKDSPEKEEKPKEKKTKQDLKIKIDRFSYKVDKLVFKDYTSPDKPSVKEVNLNLDETLENVENVNAMVAMIMYKSIAKSGIAAVANIDLKGLGSFATNSLKGSTDAAKKAATKILGETSDTLKGTTDGLKNLIKNPLGK